MPMTSRNADAEPGRSGPGRSGPGRSRPVRSAPHVPPVALLAAAAAAQVALAPRARHSRGSVLAALPLAAASAALVGSALQRFRRARTTVDPTSPERASTLVVTGANALTRNPMYVGMAGALLAHAVARRSPVGLLPVAGFVAAMSTGQIAAEEQALAEQFGQPYARYRQAVPRWVDLRTVRRGVARCANRWPGTSARP